MPPDPGLPGKEPCVRITGQMPAAAVWRKRGGKASCGGVSAGLPQAHQWARDTGDGIGARVRHDGHGFRRGFLTA